MAFLWLSGLFGMYQGCEARNLQNRNEQHIIRVEQTQQRAEDQLREIRAIIEKSQKG